MSFLVDKGGPVLPKVTVQPIFWGEVWNNPANQAFANQVVSALRTLIAGPYMRGLIQYRGISPGSVSDPVPGNSEPVNPITPMALATLVENMLTRGLVADFQQGDGRLFMVFTIGIQIAGGNGFHDVGSWNGKVFPCTWVETGDIAETTERATHELVEACTNPFPFITHGFVDASGKEIADLCTPQRGLSEGVTACYYWSNKDAACILPARTFVVSVDPDECQIGPVMNETSVLRANYVVQPSWIDTSNLPELSNPQFEWSYDTALVTPQGPTDGKLLTVKWALQGGVYETTVSYLATYVEGITLVGQIAVRPRTPWQAALMHQLCQLRKLLASETRL
jgi:hypothetical protein